MNRRAIAGFALILAGAGTLAWLAFAREAVAPAPPASAPDLPAPPAPTPAAATLPAATDGEPTSNAAPLRLEARPPAPRREPEARYLAGFRGRLVEPEGRPVPDQPVELLDFDFALAFTEASLGETLGSSGMHWRRHCTRSDAAGRFAITGVDPRGVFLLTAAPGSDRPKALRLERAPRSGEVIDLGDLVLAPKPGITGRVVDAAGQPVEGARVRVLNPAAVGVRAFAEIGKDLRADLLDPEGFVLWERRDDPRALQVLELPAWVARLVAALHVPETLTGADGRFRLTGLDPTNSLVASKSGHAPAYRMPLILKDAGEHEVGDLALGAGHAIGGRVVDARGQPVTGAEVLLGPTSFKDATTVHLLAAIGRTGGDGTFTAGGQLGRPCFVAVRRAGTRAWQAAGPFPYDQPITVTLPAALTLTIELAGGAREPADVEVLGGPAQGELLTAGLVPAVRQGRVGAAEPWQVQLPPGAYTLLARARGAVPYCRHIQLAADLSVPLELAPAHDLEVVVVDPTGAPITGARVYAQPEPAPAWAQSVLPARLPIRSWSTVPSASGATDERGRTTLAALPAGLVQVTARHPGFGCGTVSASVPHGPLEIRLSDAGSLEGQVLREGSPLTEAVALELWPAADPETSVVPASPRLGTTTADGRFAFANLNPGEYVLALVSEYDRARTDATFGVAYALTANRVQQGARPQRHVRIDAAATTRVQFELSLQIAAPDEPRIAVIGTVFVNGVPAVGRKVQVWQQDCYRTAPGPGRFPPAIATVVADGSFALPQIRSPQITRKVRANVRGEGDLLIAGQELEVDPNASEVRFEFAIDTGSLTGEVVDEDGNPAKARVGIASAMVPTDEQGRFFIPEIAVGAYQVQVFGKGITNLRDHRIETGTNHLRVVLYEFVRCGGTVDLRHVDAPAGFAITVVLLAPGGAFNYRPMGLVDRATGRFEIGEAPMAGEYEFFLHCNGKWYRHPEILPVYPRKASDLRLLPVPCAEPKPAGPGLIAPKPPMQEPPPGQGLRPGPEVKGMRPLTGK